MVVINSLEIRTKDYERKILSGFISFISGWFCLCYDPSSKLWLFTAALWFKEGEVCEWTPALAPWLWE